MGHRGPARLSCRSPWGAGPQPAAGYAAPPAGRRSGPKGQAGASAGGLPGAPPSQPRRSGGPYRRAAARRRCAAAAPRRGRPGNGPWPGLNKITLFCTPEGPWLGGPQPTTRTLLARPSQAREALPIAGWPGCAPGTGRTRPPQLYKTTCFVQGRARPGQRLNLWRRRSPRLAERPPPWGCIRRSPRPGARGGGEWGSCRRSSQPHPPEWRPASAGCRPAALARAGRRSGPKGQAGARARALGPGRRSGPKGQAGASGPRLPPSGGGGGGAQAGILDNRTVCHQGHLGSGSIHKGGLRYAPGTEARCGPL